ncbi:MAG TPA: aldo/keto reductase [Candidatus Anaerobiospirillum pullistercoris]|uniref:Aldo/keto reductase n=1 Tax=Candidatus Anaerobiospirillum pullistercoris TaxID=2838452 RepID=A0A9D2B1J0_9GAMM|nr:aldo/keto reductase [Candidatus Anaerobiospirillum pullistercoris]
MQHLVLNNGVKMPILGFGVFQIPEARECERVVTDALGVGYRLIDTAQAYGNEEAVGKAIRASGVPRDEIFLTSKVWISNSGENKAMASIDESLRKLNTDYLDLMLIHQPFGDYYGTYRALEQALKMGKCRAIGLSNFFADRLVDLCNFMEVRPQVNQMETHVFQQQVALRPYLDKYKVQLESWGPFAEGKNNFFTQPLLTKIAAKRGKSVAQVALRFLIQSGIIAIPKSAHRQRMEENIDVFDFELKKSDMEQLRGLDTKRSLFCNHHDPEFVQALVELR